MFGIVVVCNEFVHDKGVRIRKASNISATDVSVGYCAFRRGMGCCSVLTWCFAFPTNGSQASPIGWQSGLCQGWLPAACAGFSRASSRLHALLDRGRPGPVGKRVAGEQRPHRNPAAPKRDAAVLCAGQIRAGVWTRRLGEFALVARPAIRLTLGRNGARDPSGQSPFTSGLRP